MLLDVKEEKLSRPVAQMGEPTKGPKRPRIGGRKMKKKLTTTLGLLAFAVAIPAAHAEDAGRFAPLKAEELTPPQKALADRLTAPPRNGNFNNPPYRAYIRSPELAERLIALADYLRWHTSLPLRLSELAILITAREWTAQYEWYAHYPHALEGGLDPKVAAAIAAGGRPDGMKDDETALFDLVTSLHREKKVSDTVYKAAFDKFGERGIMDIIGIIGFYGITSMTLATLQAGVPDGKPLPLPGLAK
jgi:4-carboxymuconolactone decarboxylase